LYALCCRASQGARGLKRYTAVFCKKLGGSRLARGAWIETLRVPTGMLSFTSRLARGAWIETTCLSRALFCSSSRASQGARGLKQLVVQGLCFAAQVAPRKGRVD